MKKILFTALVASMGMFASAASLDWKYTSSKAEYDAGYTAYVVLGNTALTDWESASAVATAALPGGSGNIGEYGSRTKTYYAAGAIESGLNKGDSYYFVIVNDQNQYKVSDVYAGTGIYDPDNQESSPGATTLDTASLASADWHSFGGGGAEPVTPGVPEPTSGLLMLVGLGALALRRRR